MADQDANQRKVREMLNYLDALVKHDPDATKTTGQLSRNVIYVFESTLTKDDKKAIRRALRGKP